MKGILVLCIGVVLCGTSARKMLSFSKEITSFFAKVIFLFRFRTSKRFPVSEILGAIHFNRLRENVLE